MDTVIRRYRIRIEETILVITHPAGISFDLTLDEALALMDYIDINRQELLAEQCDTEPALERITIDEVDKGKKQPQFTVIEAQTETDTNAC